MSTAPQPDPNRHEASRAILAARYMDWTQVVCHQGTPCFHIDDESGHFCGRASTWAGHVEGHDHIFVSLESLFCRALDHAAAQVCEWKDAGHDFINETGCNRAIAYLASDLVDFPFCPACGRRVKIMDSETTTDTNQ